EIEARCRTQFNDGWQVEGEDEAIFNLTEGFRCTSDNRTDAVFFTRARFPWLKADKDNTGVLSLSAKAKAVNGKHRLDVCFFLSEIILLNLIQDLLGSGLCGTRRELDH